MSTCSHKHSLALAFVSKCPVAAAQNITLRLVTTESPLKDAGDDDDDDGLPLPAHAHDLILDRLPVRNRCRMWCVCKEASSQPLCAGLMQRSQLPRWDPSCYYILLNTRFLFPTSFEFFESRSACWKEVNNPHLYFKSGKSLRNFVSSHPSSDQLSVVDADFWWLVSSMDNREHCLLAYHVSLDAWTSLLVPLIPCEIVLAQIKSIVKFEGRLLLGVPCVGPDHGNILGFGVWELQLGGGSKNSSASYRAPFDQRRFMTL
ncbi:hypothetical protein GOP47_0024957 [Adiantum capillus-veneris]|uniref:Uncharacterized protein n=1 Tax=Adiantum capillus-veneris TaxID=13818 RepID=A0A9D4U3S0_ADICA|nr:hypothetical protein GOP47_0024957 [Adiantum capillus-veneris]